MNDEQLEMINNNYINNEQYIILMISKHYINDNKYTILTINNTLLTIIIISPS